PESNGEEGAIYGLEPQADGKILVTGAQGPQAFVARPLPNGNPDIPFSDTANGIVHLPGSTAFDVLIDSVSRLIVGGSTPRNIMDPSELWLARLGDFGIAPNLPQRPFHGTPFKLGD